MQHDESPSHGEKPPAPGGSRDDQRHDALRRLESRWVLPLAGVGFLAVLVLAWYGVFIGGSGVAKDGKLTAREAASLQRGGGLIGLSLEEALPLLDGKIVRHATAAGEMPAIDIEGAGDARLVMTLTNGRISRVERVSLNK